MATIKSYSDLQQSKKLAKILPLKSADMFWYRDAVTTEVNPRIMNYTQIPELQSMYYSPCWSLTALLSVLPHIQEFYPIIAKINDRYVCRYANSGIFTNGNNPIDACVAMIEKIYELKML